MSAILVLIRRDLRVFDHAALHHAAALGRPVVPVFICDEGIEDLGAAPKWRFGLGLEVFAKTLADMGSRLTFRRGPALETVLALVEETGAGSVFWMRAYDPDAVARDTEIKATLQERGIEARSFSGNLLFEPWSVATKTGGYYKVYTPFWNSVKQLGVNDCLPAPKALRAPDVWPQSDDLVDWDLGKAMNRGADVVRKYVCVGEEAAGARLRAFINDKVATYKEDRDFPAKEATSRLSENLTYGEISPRVIWHAARGAMEQGARGAEHFCKELVWREFAHHLAYHTPHIVTQSWRPEWAQFDWHGDSAQAEAWRRGQTGEPLVDAAMRELFVTGTMHNRMRMLVGSYLTKHLLTHWKIGADWFKECLIDWDPAANAMGWQWVAGCGPDAAPYFRVFNPQTQAEKFDRNHAYRRLMLEGGQDAQGRCPLDDFYAAVPRRWGLAKGDKRPEPIVSLKAGREQALAAYQRMKTE